MKKRLHSLLIVLCLLLGMLPVTAFAAAPLRGDTNRNGTVDVTMTITQGTAGFYTTPEQELQLFLEEMNVPYFDLALYDQQHRYYNPDCYTGSSQQAGTAQTADGVVTTMHVFIWATEVYVLGYDPADAGKGLGKEAMKDYIDFGMDGGAGSTFMKFWHGSTNLNYYLDYEFPLGRDGWGSTSDQQALADGTAINVHLIGSGSSASGSNTAFFENADGQRDRLTITQGEAPTLTLKRTNVVYGYPTSYATLPNTDVYYINADDFVGQRVTEWTPAGKSDANGQITLPADLEPGTWYVSSLGQDGGFQLTAAAFVLKVTKPLGDLRLGDVNDDGSINGVDAVLILKHAAKTLQADIYLDAADVNGDNSVNGVDAVLILKRAAGTITKFPGE